MALLASSCTASTMSLARRSGMPPWVVWAAMAARSVYKDPASKPCSSISEVPPGSCWDVGGCWWGSWGMGNHQADAGQAVRAQQGERGSDHGMALQGNLAGGILTAHGIDDHAGAGGVDKPQGGHVDRDVTRQ